MRNERSASERSVPLERLELERMASGEFSLRLSSQVSWESFPDYAEAVADLLDGTITTTADSPSERVYAMTSGGQPFWIALDDFGLGVSLEPQNAEAGRMIPEIRDALLVFAKAQFQQRA